MNRRTLFKHAAVTLPFTVAFLKPILSAAQESDDWISVPGTDGKLMIKNLFVAGTAKCVLYKLAPGFPVSAHRHPAGEYNYMVEGSFESEEGLYKQGDAIYKEPGSIHARGQAGNDGAIIFVFTPEPIVRIP